MDQTVVVGIDKATGVQYEVVLNGEYLPVVMSESLAAAMPKPGTPVVHGPVGVEVEFDPDDPAAVMAWLRMTTRIIGIDGPDLYPDVPGDLLDDEDAEDDDGSEESAASRQRVAEAGDEGKAPEWSGWGVDTTISDHYEKALADAMGKAFDADAIARAWLNRPREAWVAGLAELDVGPVATGQPAATLPSTAGKVGTAVAKKATGKGTRQKVTDAAIDAALAWLRDGDQDALREAILDLIVDVITDLIVEAFLVGLGSAGDAIRALGGAKLVGKVARVGVNAIVKGAAAKAAGGASPPATPPGGDTAVGSDDDGDDPSFEWVWQHWKPGDPDAARKVIDKNGGAAGLEQLLQDSPVRLYEIADERFAEFARILAQSLADGDSADTLARKLRVFQGDRVWARRTAITETARAVSAATIDRYIEHGITHVEWLISPTSPEVKVCKLCAANAAAGAVKIGKKFPSGAAYPPQHPNCRCALIPVVEIEIPEETLAWLARQVVEADASPGDGDSPGRGGSLKKYWVSGKGAAKWTTWRALFKHLRKYIDDVDMAKRTAASWYHARYGRWPNDKGKPGKGV